GMTAEVAPGSLSLKAGETGLATVRVTVPANIAPGAQEIQTLVVAPQGGNAVPETIQLITLRRLPSPYLVHTKDGWDEVRAKVAKFDWAKQEAAKTIAAADEFQVPEVPPGGIGSDQGTKAVFK